MAEKTGEAASSWPLGRFEDRGALDVDQVRDYLRRTQQEVDSQAHQLLEALPDLGLTARTAYLHTLAELIGRPPPGKTWEEEWVKLRCESFRMSPTPSVNADWTEDELKKFVLTTNTVELFQKNKRQGSIDTLVANGWAPGAARVFAILSVCSGPIARALNDRDPCYVASTYALCEALYSNELASSPPPMLYRHLHGQFSLMQVDSSWGRLLQPDSTGFCGLTNFGLTFGDCDPLNFSETGYMRRYQDKGCHMYVAEDSDVVAFISTAEDEHGSHSAVMTYSDKTGAFPPNTLFRLKKIIAPGAWKAPGGVFPKQRLIVCSATYLHPDPNAQSSDGGARKFCESEAILSYGDRTAFIKGLDDLIAKPLLTMAQECDRSTTWCDWKGVEYCLRTEWEYVNGPAVAREDCTPGHRDANNAGKTPHDFHRDINALIKERREQGFGASRPVEHAFLSVEEVLAVRLYSGPAYQLLNTFLRDIASLSAAFRRKVAVHTELTLTMTVRHLCCAIRKLAAVSTDQETRRMLYRGVRGELPQSFFLSDERDMVCAVDMGFMSTSKNRHTPVDYMGPGQNVLWELEAQAESDVGFHCGADISRLSQFAGEEEVLFPPCTMLRVMRRAQAEAPEAAQSKGRWMVEHRKEGSTHYLAVHVRPCFL